MKKISALIILTILIIPSILLADVESPDDFELEATSSTITVKWTANTNSDTDSIEDTEGYYIRWEKNDSTTVYEYTVKIDELGLGSEEFIITGLDEGTSYKVVLTAYSGDTESTSNTDTITTDSVDSDDVNIAISGIDEITVSIDAEGSNVEEFTLKIGTSPGGEEKYGDADNKIDSDESYSVSGLEAGTTYYIEVTPLPGGTAFTPIEFKFESTHTFLSDAEDDIENGCFIATSHKGSMTVALLAIIFAIGFLLISSGRLSKFNSIIIIIILLIAPVESIAGDTYLYKNNFGIKGGLFLPNESDQKDVYEEIVPFSFFYERILTDHFSADIDLGYSKADGTALSTSSVSTALVTELKMYPAAVSINFNYDVAPYMMAYVGVGGDWWLVEEKSEIGEFDSEVGGWHAKTGLKIFSDELDTFKQVGCLFEVSYAEIDRFGSNDIDLGGWKFSIGLFYCL